MLHHCKRCYRVLSRVDKPIDDASGWMLLMKTPCNVLDGVDASGEHLRFCAQHNYAFWREAWLERVEDRRPPVSAAPVESSERARDRT
jgi:hypothetical protein